MVFPGHKSLGNSHPAEHLLDGQTAHLGQTPLTTVVTTSQGGSRLPGQAKTHLMQSSAAADVSDVHTLQHLVKATVILFYDQQ